MSRMNGLRGRGMGRFGRLGAGASATPEAAAAWYRSQGYNADGSRTQVINAYTDTSGSMWDSAAQLANALTPAAKAYINRNRPARAQPLAPQPLMQPQSGIFSFTNPDGSTNWLKVGLLAGGATVAFFIAKKALRK